MSRAENYFGHLSASALPARDPRIPPQTKSTRLGDAGSLKPDGEGGIGKSDAALNYKSMSPEDRRSFDRWLKANAIFGLILAAGVVAMAFAGSRTVGSRDATMADNRDASDVAAAAARSRQTGVPSTD